MGKRHAMAWIGGCLLLAGCGPSAESAQRAPKPMIKVQGDEQRQLAAANDLNRAVALKRAIRDAGSTCQRATATGFVTDYKNMSMWQATCGDGGNWAIFVAANGAIQVRPCADLKELKLPECKTLAKPAAGAKPAA